MVENASGLNVGQGRTNDNPSLAVRLEGENSNVMVGSAEVVRRELIELAHRGPDSGALVPALARILGRAVRLDGICLLTMDPSTMPPTGELVHNGLPAEAMPRMVEIEIAGTDFNAFAALARTKERVASLSQATSGDLDRSVRHRELTAERTRGRVAGSCPRTG